MDMKITAEHKGHYIQCDKASPDADWYITVIAPTGVYSYDGYWRDSAARTPQEAVAEAIRGAAL